MKNLNKTTFLKEVMIGGVPIDNLTTQECVDKIISFVKQYKETKNTHYVATVNVDFLVNALSWKVDQSPRHPELLEILRKADISTADGMPIVWLSKLINSPIQTRVAGSDLLPEIASKAAEKGISIFLLGGQGNSAEEAASILKLRYPKLKIAGTYSPRVYSEGEQMLSTENEDKAIIDTINQSGTDLLFIGFGNPKQELWFNRNRQHLKVAAGIGIGGSFDFITGNVKRAPLWMQKSGLEWLYRISQDPKRLWKRYAIGFFKLGFIALPMIAANKLFRTQEPQNENHNRVNLDTDRKSRELMIKLPNRLDANSIDDCKNQWLQSKLLYNQVNINFKHVEFIDSTALGKLVRLYNEFKKNQIKIITSGLENPQVISLLKLSRLYDFFESTQTSTQVEITESEKYHLKGEKTMYTISKNNSDCLTINIKGRMDAFEIEELDIDSLLIQTQQHHCILNLSELKFLDSTGLRFFFKLEKSLKNNHKKMVLVHTPEVILQLLKINQLQDYFSMANDEESAQTLLVNTNK